MNPKQRFPHLAQRLFNAPLMLHPAKAEVLMAALADRLGIAHIFRGGVPVPTAFMDEDHDDDAYQVDAYDVVDGVALVPIQGTLVHRLGCWGAYSGMMGYDGIRGAFQQALADDRVKAIALMVDSPGGESSGLFDLVDSIFAARKVKPIWAIVDDTACSAAYALASAASRVTLARTGQVGSIGVLCVLADISQALSKDGITVNVIQYGARKADGMAEIPLAPEARARFQASVDMLGDLFCETVARNRGLQANAVRRTEASTFWGEDAVKAGLADEVLAPDAAFAALLKKT